MDKKVLGDALRKLAIKMTDAHVVGNGSATITVHANELYAIEEAIEVVEGRL